MNKVIKEIKNLRKDVSVVYLYVGINEGDRLDCLTRIMSETFGEILRKDEKLRVVNFVLHFFGCSALDENEDWIKIVKSEDKFLHVGDCRFFYKLENYYKDLISYESKN